MLLVFGIFFYTYSYLGFEMFKSVEYEDPVIGFNTFSMSCRTMIQVFLGEGWDGILVRLLMLSLLLIFLFQGETVSRTNTAVVWFFASYAFLSIVIFSQLLIGLIIERFQAYERMKISFAGQVEMALYHPLRTIPESSRDDVLKELGRISAILYAPELLYFARVEAYKQQINTFFGGDIQLWAASLVIRAHHRWLRRNWLASWTRSVNRITRVSQQWDRPSLISMLHHSYEFCGMDCNMMISTKDQLIACLKVACMNFNPALLGSVLADLADLSPSDSASPERRPWDFVHFASYLMKKIAENIGIHSIDSEELRESPREELYESYYRGSGSTSYPRGSGSMRILEIGEGGADGEDARSSETVTESTDGMKDARWSLFSDSSSRDKKGRNTFQI